MIELLPRDSAPLSPEAGQVLEVLYDEFDRASEPIEDMTIILAFTGKFKRPNSTVLSALGSQELSPYLYRPDQRNVPTLRAALRLRKEADLSAADQLYTICYGLMKQRRHQVPASEFPESLRERLPRLSYLLRYRGFASISIDPQDSAKNTVFIHQRILDAETFGEFLVQEEEGTGRRLDAPKPDVTLTRIESLSVAGFRSFSAAEVKGLGAFTVFAGPNEAGKSNFFKALQFISTTASQGIQAALDSERGLGQLLRRDAETDRLKLSIGLDMPTTDWKAVYGIEVVRSASPLLLLEEDLLRLPRDAQFDFARDERRPSDFSLAHQHGEFATIAVDRTKSVEHPKLFSGQSLLSTLSDLSKFESAIRIREGLRRWGFFSFEPTALRSEPTGPGGTLRPDGRNLPEALNALATHHPTKFEELSKAFVDLLPESTELKTEVGLSGSAKLLLRERGLTDPLSQVDYSDGMLRILALLYLAFTPDKPTLVCVEEPENGLYPRLIEAMLEVIRMLSRDTQVFLTTHSVSLLNRLRPEEVVFVYRDELGSHLQRLDSRADVKKMASSFGLGSQLMMGNLEDQP